MLRSQLAINSVSTRHPDLPTALAAYAEAGFTQVEFVLPQIKEYLQQGHTLDQVRALLQQYNLRSIGGFETRLVCFGTPEAQRANHDLLLFNAQLIHELGGGTMVIGTDGPKTLSLEALDVVATTLQTLLERVEALEVTVALEFNWSPLIKSLQSAVYVVEKVNHPHVGILFDLAHYYTTPTKFEHLTPATVKWIKHVHLNDMRDKPAELSDCNSDRVLPGQGVLDVGVLIHRLEECDYQGQYAIEMFNEELWGLSAREAALRCYKSSVALCNA